MKRLIKASKEESKMKVKANKSFEGLLKKSTYVPKNREKELSKIKKEFNKNDDLLKNSIEVINNSTSARKIIENVIDKIESIILYKIYFRK
jgi:hypothetical protein